MQLALKKKIEQLNDYVLPNSFKNANTGMIIFTFMSSFLGGLRKPTEVRRLDQGLKANRYVSDHLPKSQSGVFCTMLYNYMRRELWCL